MIDGRCLLDHAADALLSQTEGLVVCGRSWPGIAAVPDRPEPDLGPLGGLNAALHHALAAGFDAVLCVPVDAHPLPGNLRALLGGDQARVLATQWAVGFWPTELAGALDRHLGGGGRSLRSWIETNSAALVEDSGLQLRNLNTFAGFREAIYDVSSL